MSKEKNENSKDNKEAEAAFERGEFAEFLVDKAFDGLFGEEENKEEAFKVQLPIDDEPGYVELGVNDSTETIEKNIKLLFSDDCPHRGFDEYLHLFDFDAFSSKNKAHDLNVVMHSRIGLGKQLGKELDKKIYNSWKKKYHPSLWQKIKKIFGL
jgi:hypothetical protein